MIRTISRFMTAVLLVSCQAAPALACAVCGGNKDSDMVKGALSGVIVMVAVTYGVLMLFATAGVVFIVRSRRLAVAARGAAGTGPENPPSKPVA